MEVIYDKLVRDKIPEIIASNGDEAIIRILTDEEYWEYLLKKDIEELEEVRSAFEDEVKKELADKLELIRAMAKHKGFSFYEIIKEADLKNAKNGAFDKKILLEKTINKD